MLVYKHPVIKNVAIYFVLGVILILFSGYVFNWKFLIGEMPSGVSGIQGLAIISASSLLIYIVCRNYFSGIENKKSITPELVHQSNTNENIFNKAADINQNAIIFLDISERITYANPTAERLLLLTPNENGNKTDAFYKSNLKLKTLDDYDYSFERQLLQKMLKSEEIQSNHLCFFRLSDDRKIIFSINAETITEGNKILGFLAVLENVTEKIQLKEELKIAKKKAERSDKLKTEFLAQISHEIRTPLNIILNSSQLIKDGLIDKKYKKLSDVFSIMKSAEMRITRTIDSILNMSELQTGTYEPEYNQFRVIEDVLLPIVREYETIAKEKKLELTIEAEEDPLIFVDRYSCSQIFANLIDNAIKYTNRGKVYVKIKDGNDTTKIEVIDTGIGIGEDFKPYLFDAFRQEQQGHTRSFEGNGLGLSLVKKFCELNKATIKVDSSLRKGSKFAVELPKYAK